MKIASLIGLVAASVVLAGAAWWLVGAKHDGPLHATPAGDEPVFFVGLESKVNTVATITVKTGDQETTIRQDASGVWHLANKGDYPAQTDRVKQVVVGLADLRGAEPKTSKPELYSKIGVQDPAPVPTPASPGETPERSSSLVTLKDSGGQVLASVIVGNAKYGARPAVYVRRAGEPQSWLALGTVDLPSDPAAWMETKLLEIPRDRVKRVTITHPPGGAAGEQGGTLTVSREKPGDATSTVQDVPTGKELKSPNAGDPLLAGLSYLQFEDVTPAAAFKAEGEGAAKPKWTADYRTFDGLVLVIQAFEKDGKTWAKFVSSFDAASAAPVENRPATLKSAEDATKEAADLSAKLSPWVFQLPEWKATALGATMASMLKETPPAPPPGMSGSPGPAIPPGMSFPVPPVPSPSNPAPPPAPSAPAAPSGPTGTTGTTGDTGATGATGSAGPGF